MKWVLSLVVLLCAGSGLEAQVLTGPVGAVTSNSIPRFFNNKLLGASAASLDAAGNLTALINASNLTSGIIPSGRIPTNVALLNAAQTFTGSTNNFTGFMGFNSAIPTHSITLGSGASGFAAYSTSDQTVNFNRVTLTFADPDWTFFNESGGSAPAKNWLFTTPANVLRINGATTTAPFQFTGALNSFPTSPMVQFAVGGTASSGLQRGFGTIFDAHQSGTAGYTAFYDYVTQSSVGSGTKLLADFGVGSTSLARIDNAGNLSRIRGVDYTWPSAQGAASTVLQNDGSGGLTWVVGGGGGAPGGAAQQMQFNNSGILGGNTQLLWDGTRTIITNGSNPYILWRQTNSLSGALNYLMKQEDSGFGFYAVSDALNSSNLFFAFAGTSSGGGKAATAYGNFTVVSNLTAGTVSASTAVTTADATATNSVTTALLKVTGPDPSVVLWGSTNDALGFAVTRATTPDTNYNFLTPTSFPSGVSFLAIAFTGTNGQLFFILTNNVGSGSGNVVYTDFNVNQFITNGSPKVALKSGVTLTNPTFAGRQDYLVAAESTNIDWAATAGAKQGITTNASFTNTFQNIPPATGAELAYSIFNSGSTSIVDVFMVGTAISTNNFSKPDALTNLASVTIASGELKTFYWSYNGNRYFLDYSGKVTSGGTVTSVTAGHGLQTYSGTAAITTSDTMEAGYKINAQTGTTYTVTTNDWGKFLTMTNASAVAVTLPQATSTTFQNGFMTLIRNIGPGLVTVTPTTSTIDNGANITLNQGFGAIIVSDGTNYWTKGLPYNGVDLTTAQTLQNKTVKTTVAGGNNVLKWIDYDKWVTPSLADESGAIITTNLASSELSGHATFSGSGATNANWVVYEWAVPDDIDTAVDLKVARFKYTTAGTSTSSITFNIGMQDMADSADQLTISLANFSNWVVMTSSPTSPAANDGFTVSGVTLTSWKSSLTAGHTVHIMINRDGAGDANNDAVTDKFFVLSYGRTQ